MKGTARAAAVTVLVALTAAGPAHAQRAEDEARRHFAQAEAYFQAGTYDKAAEEYRAAYDLVPRPVLLFNIGLAYEKMGDKSSAVDYYQRYLDADPRGIKSEEARARHEALVRELRAQSEAQDRADKAAALRKSAAERSQAGDHAGAAAALEEARSLSSDPEILFELAEAHHALGRSVLALSEYQRYLDEAATGAHRDEAARRIEELQASARGPEPAPPPPAPAPAPARASTLPAWIAFGAAAAFAGTGLVFGLSANSTLGDIDQALSQGDPPLDSRDSRLDDGRRAALIADVSFVLAGASLAAGGWLWWRARRRNAAAAAAAGGDDRDAVVISPALGRGFAGARVEVSW